MDAIAKSLAAEILTKTSALLPGHRFLVGIAGIPASGKSTFAQILVQHLNTDSPQPSNLPAILVGLDGWHLTREQLAAMPDPQLAKDKRGAHWTFDGEGYVAFVKALKEADKVLVTAPSFDHAFKDPVYDAIEIRPQHRIVVIEGLYALLSIDPWKAAAELVDERVYLKVDIDTAKKRLVERHVLTGVAKDMDEAVWRADENDMPNGVFLIDNMVPPTITVESVDDLSLSA